MSDRLPELELMPRVPRDIDRCITFVARYDWGRPEDRERDIRNGVMKIKRCPTANAVRSRDDATGYEFRCQIAAQFVIIYVYVEPSEIWPDGLVSIRAVKHSSEDNVFWGVREVLPPYGATDESRGAIPQVIAI